MVQFSAQPINAIDAAARVAFRTYCDLFDPVEVVRYHDMNPRTLQRIYNSQRYLPPGLAREAAERLDAQFTGLQTTADALRAWANHCAEKHDG